MKNIRTSYKIHKANGFQTLDVNEYAKIANAYNKFIMKLLFEGHEIKLPSRLGAISIKGRYKPLILDKDGNIKSNNVDFKTTNELWARCPECKEKKQKVYYSNEHTNGVKYTFFWSKKNVILANKVFYEMTFVRTNKRKMASLINSGVEYYVEPVKKYKNGELN